MLTAKEVAQRIGISVSLVYELCKAGLLQHTRHGRPGKRGCIRIPEDALAAYLARCANARPQVDVPPLKHIRLGHG